MSGRRIVLAVVAAALALGVGTASPAAPKPKETATADGVQARLFYSVGRGSLPEHLRLEIWRQGAELLDRTIPPYEGLPVQTSSGGKSLAVRDLDGDGEPEVLLSVNSGGAHCCELTRVYRFRPPDSYSTTVQVWGEDIAAPAIEDLDGDGHPEFVSKDSRLEDFDSCGAFACDGFPLRIWDYRAGRFVDVTRSFPRQIEADATFFLHWVGRTARQDPRGMAAAWAADEALLGRAVPAHARLVRWAQAGELRCAPCGSAQYAPTGLRFVGALWHFLQRLRYLQP